MKKISHKQLESCRLSPKAWALSQTLGSGFPRFSYQRALSNAISALHQTESLKQANAKLEEYIENNFKDIKRILRLREQLAEYASWHSKSKIVTADSNVTLNFPFQGEWQLGGIVSRVDMLETGYRGVLFEAFDKGWKSQLRMPLIQSAIAEQFGRPPEEVRVGVQDLDGNTTDETAYGNAKRKAAFSEFLSIGGIVQAALPLT
jgi:hypothetical protein